MQTVVNLIINTTTQEGLEVQAQFDTNLYPTGIPVEEERFNAIKIQHCRFHGEWNYRIMPQKIVSYHSYFYKAPNELEVSVIQKSQVLRHLEYSLIILWYEDIGYPLFLPFYRTHLRSFLEK